MAERVVLLDVLVAIAKVENGFAFGGLCAGGQRCQRQPDAKEDQGFHGRNLVHGYCP